MTRKGTRLAVIVAIALLVLIAATAFFINLYRDSIALEVARSALRDSDIQVSDVSVESISSNEVRFDVIVLELAAGGTVFIEGITLPIRVRGLRDSALHVDTLTFVPGTMDDTDRRSTAARHAPYPGPGVACRPTEPDAASDGRHLRAIRNHDSRKRRHVSGNPARADAGRHRDCHARVSG
jgi:hypothetical protein